MVHRMAVVRQDIVSISGTLRFGITAKRSFRTAEAARDSQPDRLFRVLSGLDGKERILSQIREG